jgi:hypothetical protein
VLGLRNAGKSRTWNTLFGRTVRTGLHRLTLRPGECVEIFLVAGSPEERGETVEDILKGQSCRIILCSMQYVEDVEGTLDYFAKNDFSLYVQWLNPARGRYPVKTFDVLGLGNRILSTRSLFSIRDGDRDPGSRVREIREFIYGWAQYRNLILPR